MELPRKEISPVWFLLVWLVLNLLQATFTPLDADETYYWMYAGRLDWGYFDHPPAVAILISLGKDWLPGSLGLRFGHVLASVATVAGMWHLLGRPRGKFLWLAAALVAAQPFLHVYGFIATPDGPLLLFSVLYLLAYRRFLHGPTLANGALWGLTMAGLLYSKYHGVMLIFFSVLPYLWWLLRKPGAWVAALGGAALFLPHLFWQYGNDFPSFRYHLSGRNDAYELKYTLEYLLNQVVIFSPLLLFYYVMTFVKSGPVRLKELVMTKRSATPDFATVCRWLVVGFLLFFLYTTTKGGTEAQWTALLSIPLVYLLYKKAKDQFPGWQPRIYLLAVITVGILLLARLLLMAPREWLPFEKPFDHEPWTEQLAELADGLPVMVQNSYRLASLYEFYSGNPAWTFTDVQYRLNQYDLWTADTMYHGQEVLLLGQKTWEYPSAAPFRTQTRDMLTERISDFQVAKQMVITTPLALPDSLVPGNTYPVEIVGAVPRRFGLTRPLSLHPFVIFHYSDGTMDFEQQKPLATAVLMPNVPTTLYRRGIEIPVDAPAGPVEIEFGLGYNGMPPLRGQSERVFSQVVR
ncbi:MAG: ArnT family glycosyltransferase [Lewinella sp.]